MAFQRKDLDLTRDRTAGERIPVQASAMLVRSLPGGVTVELSVNDEGVRVPIAEGDMIRAKLTHVTFYHPAGSGVAVLIFTGGSTELGVTQRVPDPEPIVDSRMSIASGPQSAATNTSTPVQTAKGGAPIAGAWLVLAGTNLTAGTWTHYRGRFARRLRATSATNMQGDRFSGAPSSLLFTRPVTRSLYRPPRDAQCVRFIAEAAFTNIGPSGNLDVGTGFGVNLYPAMTGSASGVMGGSAGLRFYIFAGGLKANAVTEFQQEPIFRPPINVDVTGIDLADWNKYEIMIVGATGTSRASASWLVNDVTVAFAEWETSFVSPIIGAPGYYPYLPTMPAGSSLGGANEAAPQVSWTQGAFFDGDANKTLYISDVRHILGPVPSRR